MKKTLSIADSYLNIYANFPRRALAFMIDCLILSVPCMLLFLWELPRVMNDDVMFWYEDSWLRSSWLGPVLCVNMAIGLVMAVYSACFHASPMQATPGKRIMGIKVVNHEGQGIHFIHAFIRQIGLTIGGVPTLLIGLILVPFTQKRQGHHDIMCDTFVIYRNLPPDRLSPYSARNMIVAGSALLTAIFGLSAAILLYKWGNGVWQNWRSAKEEVMVHRHAQFVLMLAEFMDEHDGACPTDEEHIYLNRDDYWELEKGPGIYFENINFAISEDKCEFITTLNMPWDAKLHNRTLSIKILPKTGKKAAKITCDPILTSISWVCSAHTSEQKTIFR